MEAQSGSPLRVAVYPGVAEAVRDNPLTPGSMFPSETDLGADMKASRTVVREALMLLEAAAPLNDRFGRVLGPCACQSSLSQMGPCRAKLLDLLAPDRSSC